MGRVSSTGLSASRSSGDTRRRRVRFNWRHLSPLPLLILVFTALFPLGLLLVNTFKADFDIKANAFSLPDHLHWENFANAWNEASYGPAFRNSIIVTGATVTLVC